MNSATHTSEGTLKRSGDGARGGGTWRAIIALAIAALLLALAVYLRKASNAPDATRGSTPPSSAE